MQKRISLLSLTILPLFLFADSGHSSELWAGDRRVAVRKAIYPWSLMGAIRTARGYCTGSLIAPHLLLTAADCFDDPEDTPRKNGEALSVQMFGRAEMLHVVGIAKGDRLLGAGRGGKGPKRLGNFAVLVLEKDPAEGGRYFEFERSYDLSIEHGIPVSGGFDIPMLLQENPLPVLKNDRCQVEAISEDDSRYYSNCQVSEAGLGGPDLFIRNSLKGEVTATLLGIHTFVRRPLDGFGRLSFDQNEFESETNSTFSIAAAPLAQALATVMASSKKWPRQIRDLSAICPAKGACAFEAPAQTPAPAPVVASPSVLNKPARVVPAVPMAVDEPTARAAPLRAKPAATVLEAPAPMRSAKPAVRSANGRDPQPLPPPPTKQAIPQVTYQSQKGSAPSMLPPPSTRSSGMPKAKARAPVQSVAPPKAQAILPKASRPAPAYPRMGGASKCINPTTQLPCGVGVLGQIRR